MASAFPRHVRVVFRNPQVVLDIAADGTPVFSLPYQFLMLFSKILKFTYYNIVSTEPSTLLSNGTWTGSVGLYQRGVADLSFEMSNVDQPVPFDFSFPVLYQRIVFLTQKPLPTMKKFMHFQLFTGTVWMILGFCCLAFCLLFHAMRRRRCLRTFFSTVGNTLGQPFTVPLTRTGQAILFAAWILTTFILIHAFKAILLSFLVVVPAKGINTIDELASAVANGSVQCMCFKGSPVMGVLAGSTAVSHRIIRQSIEENSKQAVIPFTYFNAKYTQRTAFVEMEDNLYAFKKNMVVSQDAFSHFMLAMPMRKKFPGRKVLDETIIRIIETGLVQKMNNDIHFRRNLIGDRKHVENITAEDDRKVIMTLEDLTGAFLVLGIGLGLAFLVFLGEVCFYYRCSRKSKPKRKIQNKTVKSGPREA